ncbi:MAG: translocation/assembly module TamB domain-containing protein [Chitinophagales bacterium]
MGWLSLCAVTLAFSLCILLQVPSVQTWLANKLLHQLEHSLDATIEVDYIHFEFWHTARIENFSLTQSDKSIHLEKVELDFDVFDLFASTISIKEIDVHGVRAFLNTDPAIDKPKTTKGGQWKTILHKINLEKVSFEVLMPQSDQMIEVDLPLAAIDLGNLVLGDSSLQLSLIDLRAPLITHHLPAKPSAPNPPKDSIIDFTMLTAMGVSIENLSMDRMRYVMIKDQDSIPVIQELSGQFSLTSDENSTLVKANNLVATVDQYPAIQADAIQITSTIDSFYLGTDNLTWGGSAFNGWLHLPLANHQYNLSNEFNAPFNILLNESFVTPVEKDFLLTTLNLQQAPWIDLLGNDTLHLDTFNAMGSLSALDVKRLTLNSQNIVIDGRASIHGLPILANTFVSLDCKNFTIKTSPIFRLAKRASIALPEFCERIPLIGIKGHVEGSLKDLAMNASVSTVFGQADIAARMAWDAKNPPNYNGSLATTNFNLGSLLQNQDFGNVQCNLDIDGYGFQNRGRELDIYGNISAFDYKDQTIDNIQLNGHLSNEKYLGQIEIFDDAVQLHAQATIDQSGIIPTVLATGNLDFLRLEGFSQYDKALAVSGRFELDGHSIDDERGLIDLSLSDWALDFDERIVALPPTRLVYSQLPDERIAIDIKSEFLSGFVSSDYTIKDIPILASSLKDSLKVPDLDGRSASWKINLSDNYNLLSIINPKLNVPGKLKLDGSIGGIQRSLFTSWSTDFIDIEDYHIEGFNGNLTLNDNQYHIQSALSGISLFDTMFFKNIEVSLLQDGDNGQFVVQSKNGNQDSLLHIAGQYLRDEFNHFKGSFSAFDIHLDTNIYRISRNNHWEIAGSEWVKLKDFTLNGPGQGKIQLEGYPYTSEDESEKRQYFNFGVQAIRLKAFSDLLNHPIYKFDGEMDFQVSIKNAFQTPEFEGSIDTRHLLLNTQDLGRLILVSEYNANKNRIDIKAGSLIREAKNYVAIRGYHGLPGHSEAYDTKISFIIDSLEVQAVEDLVPSYIRNNKGNVHGNLDLVVKDKKPNLLGYIETGKVSTTISYLNTTYNLHNQRVDFLEDRLAIDHLEAFYMDTVRSEAVKRSLVGGGNIYHQNLKNWSLDVSLSGENIQVLNTTAAMNPDYYGQAFVTGSARFYGDAQSDIKLEVSAESTPGTELFFPYEESAYAESHGFFSFKNDNAKRLFKPKEKVRINPLDVAMDLTIDQDAVIHIVLSEEDGDILTARGNGDIRLEYLKEKEEANLYGTYKIASGDYTFQLREVIDKRFYIEDGGSIQLEGSIDEAVLDVSASYRINTTPLNLIREYIDINDAAVYTEANERVPVKLLLNISNTLAEPAIDFDIDILDYDPILRNPIETKINLLRNDANNMNQQVFGLIVVNQFIPTFGDAGASNAALVSTGINNTVSELLSNQLSGYLSGWFDELNLDLDLNINYRAYDPSVNNGDDLNQIRRRELQIALSKRFMNDRMTINVGGNVDFGDQFSDDVNSGTNFTGDFEFNYAITEDRRLKFKAFSNTDYDIFDQGYRTNAGLGLSFNRSFNNISELFGGNGKSNNKDIQENNDVEEENNSSQELSPEEILNNP